MKLPSQEVIAACLHMSSLAAAIRHMLDAAAAHQVNLLSGVAKQTALCTHHLEGRGHL